MSKLVIRDEKQTRKFGLKLADKLKSGNIVALIGDLGTGKTALTKYIAEGLDVKETITSPTFTIVQEYQDGRLPLYHFDVYRIKDVEEMFEIGYEEYFFGNGVCIVEWADLISEIIPEDAIVIHLSYGEREGERIYDIKGLEAGL
ncbi:tRNA (adenosine(37)-N6)-threonylcarbamoyltransferase complex ATPase subunit type 1 TsaE [Aminipila luticellarii]|uniref:tRNA threonylcarbamoyladenosine biosynthesis protein TsaE n=1 Tax=Aminipila luticellarii TaxID=2507160 RepID=A0A410PXJ6_9FIRM|nr:tRNA (adenosine(37)-N6)-threonylcarbamoyltransferase complex ATPase subunit type 1 TsaE [Aminipila luticellarii]QAT43671.1 tRNA (adenosine(37)-N6)-threonylcarbamoyltransferase complex ATPase subunit type 1 TsaE [Aminipila luticellarii]